MRKGVLVFILMYVCSIAAFAQDRATVTVEVRAEEKPVAGAAVTVGDTAVTTDANGVALAEVSAGDVAISVTARGLAPAATTVTIMPGAQRTVEIELEAVEEEIVVSATRTDKRLDDQPTRVEVLEREEIEEKMLMTPGDIVMMLNEMGGMRVQATSPSLGSAAVRIQGMRGRYTRFLSDGLPLFGQNVGGLGLLQIPPMDLGQVEVIKGTASAMYGAGAMGGVVNLVSRRPREEPIREMLLNQSTRGATDAVFFTAAPISSTWAASLLTGGHFQRRTDVDDDGWADLAGYKRGLLRPRFFWDNGHGRSVFLTAGATYEDRTGGTLSGETLRATGASYNESLQTRHFDVGTAINSLVAGDYLLSVRFAAAKQYHDHNFGEVRERDTHETLFAEASLRRNFGRHTLVAGAALERDAYRPRDITQFRYTHVVPGVFLQDDVELAPWLSLSASARGDFHNEYGAFFSPRISALAKHGHWQARLSGGQGFFAPTPLTEETEAAGLARLTIPRGLKAERGRSASLDVTRTQGIASTTVTLFASRVQDPIDVERGAEFALVNLPLATTNMGVELLGTLRPKPFSVTASYTYVRSREFDDGRRTDVALTPRHIAGIVGMWEEENVSRVGVEFYYTGRQRLEANPYRDISRPYVIMGLLGEKRFGPIRVFINAENITGVRQTRWDPLLRPARAVDGRWTVDAWAPLDGRVFNGGVRWEF